MSPNASFFKTPPFFSPVSGALPCVGRITFILFGAATTGYPGTDDDISDLSYCAAYAMDIMVIGLEKKLRK
jgi:hypothetical protein